MFQKCVVCGFINPADTHRCLDCGRKLVTVIRKYSKTSVTDETEIADNRDDPDGTVPARRHPIWTARIWVHRFERYGLTAIMIACGIAVIILIGVIISML